MTLRRRLAQLERTSIAESRPAPRVYTYEEWEAASEEEREASIHDPGVIRVVDEHAKALTLRVLAGEGTE
jgi:hypothetical protein